MTVTTKTKVLAWGIKGDKEKLDLDVCDFAPDQVAELDRMLRCGKDTKVRLAIEPEQKKLQIPPLACSVRLVSMSCRPGGQKIKVADFKTPDDRAVAVKRLVANETPVVITITEIERSLPFGEGKSNAADSTPASLGETPHQEPLKIKCKGMKNAGVEGAVVCLGPGAWRCRYTARLGNYQTTDVGNDSPGFGSRTSAVNAMQLKIGAWLDNIELAGSADQKRSLQARRASMREQVNQALDQLLLDRAEEGYQMDTQDGGTAEEIPFEED